MFGSALKDEFFCAELSLEEAVILEAAQVLLAVFVEACSNEFHVFSEFLCEDSRVLCHELIFEADLVVLDQANGRFHVKIVLLD